MHPVNCIDILSCQVSSLLLAQVFKRKFFCLHNLVVIQIELVNSTCSGVKFLVTILTEKI